MTKVASPISTGGAGSDYENQVGAYYLAALLLQAVPRGQEAGVTREVRFQRLYEGEPLDDLIIVSELPGGEAKLALQIKRDLTFGEKNKIFGEVIQACWETFKSTNFHIGLDRFGIGIGLYSKNIDEYYQSVLTWARTSTDAEDFLKRINQLGLANQTQRSFVKLIRDKLNKYSGSSVTDDEIWNFLRSMVILYFDFQRDGSRDYSYSVEMVSHLLNADKKAEAPQLFKELGDLAAEANWTAGSFNANILRQKLSSQAFSLLSPVDCRSDLEKLRQESGFALNDIRVDIGGLSLSRTELIVNALEKLSQASLIEIVGSSGVGKSALLKTLVEHQRGEGPVLVISGDRITGAGWSSYAGILQLRQPLNKLLVALSGSSRPTIFIDGIDRIIEIGKRAVVNDLLRTLAEVPLSEDGSRHWTVVFSTREENLQDVYRWLNWQALGKPTRLEVPELTAEELQSVVEYSPRLKPLLSLSQLSPILKNPLMLRLLEDPRMLPNPEDLPPVATEIEVSNVWWERAIIGQNLIVGEAREQILINLGEQAVKSPGTRLRIKNADSEAVISLKLDRIIIKDPDRRLFRFGHDLLEDWVMLRVLNEYREELPAYLKELDEPFGLLRSVQLVGVALLENHATAESWINLIEQVEQASEISPRWRQALLTAPLVSPRCSELLDKAEPLLIADNARRLIELLVAVRTLEVMPNFSLMSLFTEEELQSSDRVMPLLMSDPIPRWSVWQPFMGWLLKRLNDLPASVRPEAGKLMEIWQVKSPTGSIYRKEIGEIAIAWLEEAEARRGW